MLAGLATLKNAVNRCNRRGRPDMRHCHLAVAAGLAALIAGTAPVAALDGHKCARAASVAEGDGAIVTPARDMTIVAIGSSSTEGIPSNRKSQLYPAMLETELRAMRPGSDIRVLNRGKGGEQLPETLARFEHDVLAAKPALVIWQLGVNDVLARQGVADRKAMVDEGLARLRAHGVPVVLLDLQFAPAVNQDSDTPAMQQMIATAASSGPHGRVLHFRRFAAMKELAEKEQVPMSEMIVGDGLHMTDAMHACIGKLLAGVVMKATVSASVAAANR
jgi:lysophospholipase L1-like esterase